MGSIAETQYKPDTVSTPGEILAELLEERGMSQAELARRTGRPTKTINEIVKGKSALTTETALQLERVFGVPARFWNNLERSYREYVARKEEAKRLSNQTDWLRKFPIRAMVQYGWIEKKQSDVEQVETLLRFFGVNSVEAWRDILDKTVAAFRKSAAFEVDPGAIAAWLRQGELEAQGIDCRLFDLKKFREALQAIRALTAESSESSQNELQQMCAEAGVAVTFVPQMPNSRVFGATRWLSPTKALIQLSLRYKTDDHFWFTFFHESAHLIRHGKKLVFLEGDSSAGAMEEEANRFAADFLIPPPEYAQFLEEGDFTCVSLSRFAAKSGIAPGIVAGRLQHDGIIPFNRCNSLKKRLTWAS
jgi:HTH-type transcriptional regulator/antitoxin HigA